MAKYSTEFKMKVVKEYLESNTSYKTLSNKYCIPSESIIRKWVNAYKSQGYEGLKVKRENTQYTLDFKLNVVNLYLTGEMSYQSLANELKINNPSIIARWVSEFREKGIEGLKSKKRGRPSKMPNSQNKSKETKIESTTNISNSENQSLTEAQLKEKKEIRRTKLLASIRKWCNEKKDRIVSSGRCRNKAIAETIEVLRDKYKLKDLLKYFNIPKSTYMYWQKSLNRANKDLEIEKKIVKIRKDNPNYGYRRITAMLKRTGLIINKKKVQRLIQKLKLQVKSYSRKSRKYSSYKGQVGEISDNKIKRNFKVEKPYTQITTDTTEFKYFEKDKTGKYQI